MRRKNRNFHLVALAMILSLASVALAQENPTGELVALKASANTRNVPDGQKLKVKGIVIQEQCGLIHATRAGWNRDCRDYN